MNLLKLIKREIIITVLSIIIIVSFFGALTYAYFMDVKETDINVIKYGDIELSFCANSECDDTIENIGRVIGRDEENNPLFMYPMSQEEALNTNPYIFKLSNTGDLKLDLIIKLDKELNPTLDSNYSDYTPVDDTYIYTAFGEQGEEPSVKIYPELEEGNILMHISLDADESKIFNLWTWLKDDVPNEVQGTYFIADISVKGEYNTRAIQNKILSDNVIKINADFTKTSLEANEYGLYKTTAYGKDIYYYRGGDHCQNSDGTVNITYTTKATCEGASLTWYTLNNNIIFGDKCWQIIRTNEDGSTRIIYNGTPTDGKCNATGTGAQVGTSAFNGNTRTIGSKTYSIYTDTSAVGYTFGSPEDGTYQVYRGAGAVSSDTTIAYGQTIGTGYILDTTTGTFTLTGTSTVSGSAAPNGTTNKYYCSGGTATCVYMYEIASDASVTHNTGTSYIVSKRWETSANWSKSEAKATANELDSTMKIYLENWYENNMLSHSDFIEDAGYCNDRSLVNSTLGYGSSGYYGAYGRIYSSKEPSNECPNNTRDLYTVNNTKGNKNAKYPIGLITADEAVYGGLKYGTEMNINSYLYTGQHYWTFNPYVFSPSYSRAGGWGILSSGNFSNSFVSYAYGVRPVVSLKSNITITGGTGSKDNPYIIN